MKKMTSILLVLALCLTMGPAALAEETPVWIYTDTSYAAYVEGTFSGDVVIPERVNDYAVTALYSGTLSGQNEITSLTLPNTLYALQDGAISNMENLQSVTLNQELEVICQSNFTYCPALTSLTIPASVRLIESAFYSCDNLREIRFEGPCPKFLETWWSFSWLPEDCVIYVPDDQLEAYAEALAESDAVSYLRPSGQNAVIPETKSNEDYFVFDSSTGTITGYKEYHAYVEIPESIGGVPVKAIGESAMCGDYFIYAMEIPEGVERIEKEAFSRASNMMYVSFPTTLKTIGDDAFMNAQVERIDWSEGLEEIGARAFMYHHESILRLPTTLKRIGESAFENSRCTELYLGGDLQYIGPLAFSGTYITYMAFDLYEPIEIAPDAFAQDYVQDLDLPWDSSLENQAAYAEIFREQCPDCNVWINNPAAAGVAEYPINDAEHCAFENGIWTMYQGDQPSLSPWTGYDDIDVTALGDGVFKGNQTIRAFYPHHCGWFTTIGNEAFADSSLEYFEPFGTITTIGSGAFRNCLNLTELTLPASLTSIAPDALAGCDNLQKLIVLCDPAILPDGLLDECFAHTDIYAAPNATDEQLSILNEKAHRPWYAPICRVGETVKDLTEMPYAMFLIDDFWYDTEYARLDRYHGYELNLYLPREAEGMTLTTIGGDMMGRARGGDNYDMELPVRSVVIPENYTEIYSTAFAGCETLEMVICYAPLEMVPASMFAGCTNLREVVFVNGVHGIGDYVFDGCSNLQTVYVGPYVQEISAVAFLNSDGSVAFNQSQCITDPALMPDIEALLAAVKSDPMPEPTPAPTAVPAAPVGEAGAPYVGLWQAETLEMEGESYPVAEMGMVMTFTLNADGTAESFDGETTESGTWTIENGTILIGGEIEGMVPMTVNESGQLVMEEDGMKLIFAKADGAAVPVIPEGTTDEVIPEVTEEPTSEEGTASGDMSAYVGLWQAETLEMEGESYPVAEMGMVMTFTLNADGTAESFDGETTESGTWTIENGVLVVEGMPMPLCEDGRLVLEDEDSKLYFVKTGFIGTWYGCYMATGAMNGDPRDMFEIVLTVNEDGSANLAYPTDEAWHWTQNEDGSLLMVKDSDGAEMPLTTLNGGFICLGSMTGDGNALGGYFVFSRDTQAVWTPDMLAQSVDESAETETDASVSTDFSDKMERKYVCTSAKSSGVTLDASMLGGEYALTFHEDGTVDFVMVGTQISGLSWTQSEETFVIDYYGTKLEATFGEDGIDMDYFGMLMHFVPEE